MRLMSLCVTAEQRPRQSAESSRAAHVCSPRWGPAGVTKPYLESLLAYVRWSWTTGGDPRTPPGPYLSHSSYLQTLSAEARGALPVNVGPAFLSHVFFSQVGMAGSVFIISK